MYNWLWLGNVAHPCALAWKFSELPRREIWACHDVLFHWTICSTIFTLTCWTITKVGGFAWKLWVSLYNVVLSRFTLLDYSPCHCHLLCPTSLFKHCYVRVYVTYPCHIIKVIKLYIFNQIMAQILISTLMSQSNISNLTISNAIHVHVLVRCREVLGYCTSNLLCTLYMYVKN